MNYENFRRTGELSDITVVVEDTEFKLHTFPLFTKSDFFKKAVASSTTTAPYVVRLDPNFPGGAETFNQVADYFYSIAINIEQKTIVPLRLAACLVECDTLGKLVDQRITEMLLAGRAKYDISIPLTLLEQCVGPHQHLAKEAHLVDKCLQYIVESIARGGTLQLLKADREVLVRFPVEWIVDLIQLCSADNKLAILPFAKYYVTKHVLEQEQPHAAPSSSGEQDEGGDHPSAFTPVAKKEDSPNKTDDEKRTIIDEMVKVMGEALEQLPVAWLSSLYDKATELNCECQSKLSSYITQSILNSTDLDDSLENIPDDLMTGLVDRANKHKEDHIKDPQLMEKFSILVDSYLDQVRQRGTLTSELFLRLASCIPKEQRASHDRLLLALDEILKDEKSQFSDDEREQLLSQIEFSRVSEETIMACKNNKFMPQQLITDTALALCAKLRNELDETRSRLRVVESELNRARPGLASTTAYRTRYTDSSVRIPPARTRPTFSSNYEVPKSTSSYSYSKYDSEGDSDYTPPPRYLPTVSSSRYGTARY